MLIGGIMFPILTEVVTPYILKEWHEPVYSISKYHELFVYDGSKPENMSIDC